MASSAPLDDRPGRHSLRPHQDLRVPSRIPTQYLSQAISTSTASLSLPGTTSSSASPSSSTSTATSQASTTPPVAVQIASLHRAAEVARYEWRATRRRTLSAQEQQGTATVHPYRPLPATGQPVVQRYAPRRANAAPSLEGSQSRVYSSSLEAYLAASRDLLQLSGGAEGSGDGLDDMLSDADSFTDSDDTEEEVLASTMRPSVQRRRQSEERRQLRAGARAGGWSVDSTPRSRGNALASTMPSRYGGSDAAGDFAEEQVWDRMVEDLAIGAGVGSQRRPQTGAPGSSPYSQGISGGIAASMLALSAAIPRIDASTGQRGTTSSAAPSRLLPHPIWARRYPGAAGEWLRGELSRRAGASSATYAARAGRTAVSNGDGPAVAMRRVLGNEPTSQDAATASTTTTTTLNDIFSNSRTVDRLGRPTYASVVASSPWSVLRFPSLDPTTRNGMSYDTPPAAEVRSDTSSGNSLTVPANASALAPTPPPEGEPDAVSITSNLPWSFVGDAEQGSSSRRPFGTPRLRNHASNLVARMAQQARERNAALAAASTTATSNETAVAPRATSSRAVRGGLDYIRRLRMLDGIERTPDDSEQGSSGAGSSNAIERYEEPPPPVPAHEVFPWYTPNDVDDEHSLVDDMARLSVASRSASASSSDFDPDGSSLHWYHMARARLAAQSALTGRNDLNNDPNGERIDDDVGETEARLSVRRRVMTSAAGTASASQRQRNRTALVMANDDVALPHESHANRRRRYSGNGNANNFDAWTPEGWTVINQRPASPVRRTRDEGSDNVTTWFSGPALSTSPGLIDHAEDYPGRATPRPPAATMPDAISDDPRTTRRPRRLASLTMDDLHSVSHTPVQDVPQRRSVAEIMSSAASVPMQPQAAAHASVGGEPDSPSSNNDASGDDEQPRIVVREGTPSPEPRSEWRNGASRPLSLRNEHSSGNARDPQQVFRLFQVGARLEEEFRLRQGELRVREERLRTEVARRRMELDQLRRQQGRIGRVVERSRREHVVLSDDAPVIRADAEEVSHSVNDADTVQVAYESSSHGTGSSTLVRRRTVRDSAPSLRSFRRPENRHTAASYALPAIMESVNRQMTLNTLAATSSRSTYDRALLLRRTRSFTMSRSQFILNGVSAIERDALDDHTIVRGRTNDVLLATTPSLSPSDVDAVGAVGALLVSYVDALATPRSIVRAARFSALPYATSTVVQPTLPSTMDDMTYPLRFELLNERKLDDVDGGSSGSGDDQSGKSHNGIGLAKLQHVLQNDETTCAVQGGGNEHGGGLHVLLKFLAATGGSTSQSKASTSATVVGASSENRQVEHRETNKTHSLGEATALSKEEHALVQRCLDRVGSLDRLALLDASEIFDRAREVGQELLALRTDALSRLALLRPPGSAHTLVGGEVGQSFCLTKLVIKIPHRHTLFANLAQASSALLSTLHDRHHPWMALVFVSWTPIRASDLDAYDGWSEEDVRRVARQTGRRGPGFDVQVRDGEWETVKRPIAFDDDETLGDPKAMIDDNSSSGSKGKQKSDDDSEGSAAKNQPTLIPVGMAYLKFTQTVLDFDRADDDAGASQSGPALAVCGVAGRYLAIKVMRARRATQQTAMRSGSQERSGAITPPALEIQWIGAQGWAGPRSFGSASWRDGGAA